MWLTRRRIQLKNYEVVVAIQPVENVNYEKEEILREHSRG